MHARLTMPQPPQQQGQEDVIEEASTESFPASDAPGWTGTRAGAPSHVLVTEHVYEPRAALRADLERIAAARRSRDRPGSAVEDLVAASMLEAGRSVLREPSDGDAAARNVECDIHGADPAAPAVVVVARCDVADPSGPAMLLALVRALATSRMRRPVRLVALASAKGAAHHLARLSAASTGVHVLVSIARADLSRRFGRGGLLFIGGMRAMGFLRGARAAFRAASRIPVRALWIPTWLQGGDGLRGAARGPQAVPVITITDAAPWSARRRGEPEPDVDRMAAAVPGLTAAIVRLAGGRV